MKLKFKPEDFFKERAFYPDEDSNDWAARVANKRLAEMLAEAPKVSGSHEYGWGVSFNHPTDTHTARLVDIQEVKK